LQSPFAQAKEMVLKVAISTDAHSTTDLNTMRLGGWPEPADVLNTRSWPELKKLLVH
jgi:DNA polymerase (family 10)